MTENLPVGARLPAYCTSQGRILLGRLPAAALDRILRDSAIERHTKNTVTSIAELKRLIRRDHARGWSALSQEFEQGICSLSVPVLDRSGQIIAALNVASSLSRTTPRRMVSTILPKMIEAAREIHSLL